MAPVAHGLAARGCRPTLVLTGQHPHLPLGDLDLEAFPAVRLSCPGKADPHNHVRRVTAEMLRLLREKPDLLVVQGDSSSALGAALAGFLAGVPVAHVEAGLRTHDSHVPWPEEQYRVAIDMRADLLFAPTETAAANLRTEQVPGEVHVTGNTGIDSLFAVQAKLPPRTPSRRRRAAAAGDLSSPRKLGRRDSSRSPGRLPRSLVMGRHRLTLCCTPTRTSLPQCAASWPAAPESRSSGR